MPRAKKDSKVLNIRLSIDIYNKLESFCNETGQTKTTAVERFLDKGIDEYFEKPENERKPN